MSRWVARLRGGGGGQHRSRSVCGGEGELMSIELYFRYKEYPETYNYDRDVATIQTRG